MVRNVGLSTNLTFGYGHPAVLKIIGEQLEKLHNTDLSVASHEAAGILAKRLAGILPKDLTRILFVNSGSEGVEAAVFIATYYWTLIESPRKRIIAFAQGYHGSTLVSRAIGNLTETSYIYEKPFPVTHIDLPYLPKKLRSDESCQDLLDIFADALNENKGDDYQYVLL
jgi:adenosylmethionine-8-amino-7-oxononanoate aminotransferase